MKEYLKQFILICIWLFYYFATTPLLANEIYVPPNAYKSGNMWYCNSGYKRSGDRCVKLNVPANAYVSGNYWYCNSGYKRSGNACIKLNVPANAYVSGNYWYCNSGYKRSGDRCVKLNVPANAYVSGNYWYCNSGYKRSGDRCVPMTKEDIQKQKELQQAIMNEMQKRRLQGVSGDDCETEYRTNAEVCVEITGADIDCNKSYLGNYYGDCDVTLSYDVETDYQGGSYLDVEVECTVEIEYKGRQTYFTQNDSSNEDESHSLYAYDSDSETMNFNFSFTSFQEVTSVQVSSAECEIDSVDLQ